MRKLLTLALSVAALPSLADTVLTDADLANAYANKGYSQRIVCHDPSIFMDTINHPKSSPRYYIYGSHLGAGYTTAASNYQNWGTFGGGESANCTLFADLNGNRVGYANAYNTHAVKRVKNYQGTEVAFGNFNAHEWQYKGDNIQGNQWAADAIYNPTMKKWLMYMSINGDHWGSVIVCLTSDSPQGPWVYQGPVVFSGFQGSYDHNGFGRSQDYKHTDLEIAIGEQATLPARYNVSSHWGTYYPNCIDPCVFYDEQGKLWMSYGSWSGGIFIIELDETNGLRDYTVTYPLEIKGTASSATAASADMTCDPYFGRKIAGGYYVSGEASYIEHIGNYYYLFMSYGGLVANGGYQIRVFRSEKPDGPYKDCCTASGQSAIFDKYILNYGRNIGRCIGVKILSNYQWDTMPTAELAQGHNSAIVDHEGRALLVYHTRFNNGTEGHQVRVHQMFVNEDGWLVTAPYEFSGETPSTADIAAKQLYTADEVAGDYQLIAHPYNQDTDNKAYETPVTIHLNSDGTITGPYTGTWQLVEGTSYINLSLKGAKTGNSATDFKGVLTRQSVDYTDISALCFTALSSSSGLVSTSNQTRGLLVWGSKADAKAAIKFTIDKVSVGPTVNSDLTLPGGKLGATIEWKSSDTGVLSDEGKIVSNGQATLTATIRKDGYVYTKQFPVTVDGSATPVYFPECGAKDFSNGWWQTFSPTYTLKAGTQCQFKFYNYTKGEQNWQNWALYGCRSFSSGTITSEYFGVRADNWDNTTGSNTGCSSNYNWDTFKTDMDGSLVDMTCSLASNGVFDMKSTITTKTGTVYTYTYRKTISARPAEITLFFVTEAAWIGPEGPNGESLGIEDVRIDTSRDAASDGIYDLYGRRLNGYQRGLNIVGGRKVIIR